METKGKTLSKDYTKGNIPKQLFRFMVPFMLSNAMQILYSAVDMVIVGRYVGSGALAAVSQGSVISNFGTMVTMGFSTAGQTLIAQMLGAGRKKELNGALGTMFSTIELVGILIATLLFSLKGVILSAMNLRGEAYAMGVQYLGICGAGIVLTAAYNVLSAALRGMGDSKRPFLFIAIASVTNLILDVLFTGVLGWGVAGAAWATVIGQGVSVAFSLVYLYRRREGFHFDFKPGSFRIREEYLKIILRLGLPMACQSALINVSMAVVNSMINNLGVVATATFGVGCKIDDICTKIHQGIQFAAAPMIGQNLAAGEHERAKKVVYFTWLYAAVLTALFLVPYLTMGKRLFSFFTDDEAVLAMAPVFISAIKWTFIPLAGMRGSNSFIQGLGFAGFSFVIGIVDGVLLRIGLSYLFGSVLGMGFYGFVLGYGLAPCGAAIPGAVYFFSGAWKKRRLLVDRAA